MAKISVCINSLNSEKTIENTLKSLSKAYEIILCDMHSEDNTVNIAEQYGAKVVYHERAKYAEIARNFCISHATGDWILVVDTDEVVPEALWNFLNDFADKNDNDFTTVSFPIQDYVFEKPMHCMYRKCVKRFWKKNCAEYTTQVHGMVHTTQGKDFFINPKEKQFALQHYHVDSFESYIEKINRYTTLEMDKFKTRNKKFSYSMLFLRPLFEFCKIYFLKQGFKDGLLGFIMAGMHTFYQFSRSAKMYEYNIIKKIF